MKNKKSCWFGIIILIFIFFIIGWFFSGIGSERENVENREEMELQDQAP